jgi:molybdopterin/thiamine biosynthesis adenylyltransferase
VRAWFERWPDLFRAEREGLEAIGFALDAGEFARGRVVFDGCVETDEGPTPLTVVLPASYPFLRPEVYAPQLAIGRHRNPFRGNLCLLDRSTSQWDPGDSARWLVETRVPHLLALLAQGGDALREGEAPQGEPASRYLHPGRGAAFVPEAMLHLAAEHDGGSLELRADLLEPDHTRACLTRVLGGAGAGELAVADAALARRFGGTRVPGTWVRLASLADLTGPGAEDVLRAARAAPGYREPQWHRHGRERLKLVGVVAAEEATQGADEDTWMFVLRRETTVERRRRRGHRTQETRMTTSLVRGERLGRADLEARIPALRGLHERRVALAGLGALGAPLALELAKALVGELRLLDFDASEAGNAVRWPFGISAAGVEKAALIARVVADDWPFTAVKHAEHQIGAALPAAEASRLRSEVDVISDFVGGADLLVDATAELGVQQFLADQADSEGVPQVYVTMTEGGWGGIVARVVPGATGCWLCLQHHLDDGSIALPPREAAGTVQPRGCGSRTYTGTGFDALPLVAQACRVTADTLLRPRADDADDVFVCSQGPDLLRPAAWAAYPLARHPECAYCAGAA